MNDWRGRPFLLIDTETTGIQPHLDRIVQFAAVHIHPHVSKTVHEHILQPDIPVPDGAAEVHGITTERAAREGIPRTDGITQFAELIIETTRQDGAIIGHNIGGYDLTILWCELHRIGREDLANQIRTTTPVIDTMTLSRWLQKFRPKQPTKKTPDPEKCGSYSLADSCRINGVKFDGKAHTASADAIAAGRLAWRLADLYPGARGPAIDIHRELVHRSAEWAEGYGAYLRKQGKTDDAARDWPWQPPPAGWAPDQLPITREDVPA